MTNTPEHAKTRTKWVISDALYDLLRKLVNFVIPALVAFYLILDNNLHIGGSVEVGSIGGGLVVLLNVLLLVSKKNFNEIEAQTRGTVYINTNDPDGAIVGLDLEGHDPDKLAKQRTVTLNVNSQ